MQVMNQSTVAIHEAQSYDADEVHHAVSSALSSLPDLPPLSPGKTVLLKPNLLSASQPPQNAVNTHFSVIKSVAEYCLEQGCRVRIGDSCGSMSKGSTQKALNISGINEICEDTGAEPVNFDMTPYKNIQISNGRIIKRINISRSVLDADVIITLPKLKTHGLTLLTGAVKNQYGTVPGKYKKEIHLQAPKPFQLAQAAVDIFSIKIPHLAVMDAIDAMEGNGPSGGDVRHTGLILASLDSVALDAVAGAIIGYAPEEIMTTFLASARGMGNGDWENIKIKGIALEKAKVDDFKRPSPGSRKILWRLIPHFLARKVIKHIGPAKPVLIPEKCVLCGECVINCPADAIKIEKKAVHFDLSQCIGCYCCNEACPHKAIDFK